MISLLVLRCVLVVAVLLTFPVLGIPRILVEIYMMSWIGLYCFHVGVWLQL